MAKIEIANLKGEKIKHANISDLVGLGKRNEKNDVMLIQALFKIAGGNSPHITKDLFGLESYKDLPKVTGDLDPVTIKTIWQFQRINAHRLLSVDGVIHPASYGKRVLKEPFTKPVMMITFLNIQAEYSTRIRFKDDLAFAIKNFAPSIVLV
jgi:hypothetical protein